MPRDPDLFLEDMLEAIARIREYAASLDEDSFATDQRTVDAVARNLDILGEAAKHVSEERRALCPEVQWRQIAGLRDVLIHQYFVLDIEILWDVITTKLGPLEEAVRRLLGRGKAPVAPEAPSPGES